eukprot:2680496-Pyramimonas_sp.AAC.1
MRLWLHVRRAGPDSSLWIFGDPYGFRCDSTGPQPGSTIIHRGVAPRDSRHEAQQANLSMQLDRQRPNHGCQANRMLGRAEQPAIPITAGTPAFNPAALAAMEPPSAPPIQYEVGRLGALLRGLAPAKAARPF